MTHTIAEQIPDDPPQVGAKSTIFSNHPSTLGGRGSDTQLLNLKWLKIYLKGL